MNHIFDVERDVQCSAFVFILSLFLFNLNPICPLNKKSASKKVELHRRLFRARSRGQATLLILSTEFCILNSLFKTCQKPLKIDKNSKIFTQNHSKANENLTKFEEILQNLQFTCAFGRKSRLLFFLFSC